MISGSCGQINEAILKMVHRFDQLYLLVQSVSVDVILNVMQCSGALRDDTKNSCKGD